MKQLLCASTLLLSTLSTAAFADHMTHHAESPLSNKNWEVSANYTNSAVDIEGTSANLNNNILSIGFAYEIRNPEGHLSFIPELYLGRGIGDDEIVPGTYLEVDSYVQVGLRLVLHTTETFHVYLRPVATRASYDIEIPALNEYASDSEGWDFGGGVGVGMNFDEHTYVTLGADRISGDEVDYTNINLSLRYRF